MGNVRQNFSHVAADFGFLLEGTFDKQVHVLSLQLGRFTKEIIPFY